MMLFALFEDGIDIWDSANSEPLERRKDDKTRRFARGIVAASWVTSELLALACVDGREEGEGENDIYDEVCV